MNEDNRRPEPIVVERKGSLQKLRWPDTGEETWMIIEHFPERTDHPVEVFLTMILQPHMPVYQQVAITRRLFPDVGMRKGPDVLHEAKETGKVEIGVLRKFDADPLIEEAKKQGLRIEARVVGGDCEI